MMEEKIIQIMGAPDNLYAIYENEEDPSNPMESKIVCLALTNIGNVFPMDMDDLGHMDDISTVSNFEGIKWKEDNKQ